MVGKRLITPQNPIERVNRVVTGYNKVPTYLVVYVDRLKLAAYTFQGL